MNRRLEIYIDDAGGDLFIVRVEKIRKELLGSAYSDDNMAWDFIYKHCRRISPEHIESHDFKNHPQSADYFHQLDWMLPPAQAWLEGGKNELDR